MSTEIKVMSFNLRYENDYDGEYRFEYRKERILSVIAEENPDLIGFQEGTDPMRAWLGANLPDYLILSCGRNSDYRGEGGPVAIRRDRFNLLSYRTVWLSPTPDVAGSRHEQDQSGCPRIYQETRLVIPGLPHVIRFTNTHTDHVGSKARLLEVEQLLGDLGDPQNEVLLFTGDFNAEPDAPEIRYMTEGRPELKLADASLSLGGTFHDFGRQKPIKIDYIFTNVPFRDSRRIHREPDYVSDHDPIVTTLILE